MNKKSWIILLSVLVAFLNLFDGVATFIGLENHYIDESNPFMKFIFTVSPVLFVCFKIVLSLLIFYVSFLIYKHSNSSFQDFYLFTLVGVSCFYIGIFGLHVFWISSFA
ncbi:DUF5658 family protein [Lysinibacillus endophyticus]|uniref:DUF5658 family protein n=1 Tax=Ureibacillus endophyticus TaxID=1978490 RepID=UPI003135DA45